MRALSSPRAISSHGHIVSDAFHSDIFSDIQDLANLNSDDLGMLADLMAFAGQVEAACQKELIELKGTARVYYLEAVFGIYSSITRF